MCLGWGPSLLFVFEVAHKLVPGSGGAVCLPSPWFCPSACAPAADDFFAKQLPHNVTWLLTLLYALDQTGGAGTYSRLVLLVHTIALLVRALVRAQDNHSASVLLATRPGHSRAQLSLPPLVPTPCRRLW